MKHGIATDDYACTSRKTAPSLPGLKRRGFTELPITVIQLDLYEAVCAVCAVSTVPHWGIPVWEGLVLPNAWPHDWIGADACAACWTRQQALTQPVPLARFRREGPPQ